MDLLIGTDQTIILSSLANENGEAVTNATVEATLTTIGGEEVQGQNWPVSLSHEGNGKYQTVLEDTLDLTPGRHYVITVVAELGQTKRTWRQTFKARWSNFNGR